MLKKVKHMMKKTFFAVIVILLSIRLYSDERKENIDIFILLDKSLSMENNIDEVKEYIQSYIVDNIIINGDRLLIINFYGKTEKYIDSFIDNNDVKGQIKDKISDVRADGRFTDIGSALDTLSETAGEETERLRYMLLITDGKQEAPPGTKYYSPDGSFNHELLRHTRVIQKKGWKIEVLGIGKLNKAADIAEKLSGTYIEVDKAVAEDLAEKTSDFLTIININKVPELKKLNRKNESVISFSAVSSNTDNDIEIIMDSIRFTAGEKVHEMLPEKFRFIIEPDIVNNIDIPVMIKDEIPPGNIKGSLEFFYVSENILTPSLFDIELVKSKGINPLLIFIAAGIPVLIILLFIFKNMKGPGKSDKDSGFDILIDNEKISEIPYILKNNEKLFLAINNAGEITLSRIKSAFSKGYLVKSDGKISFQILDSKLFPDFKDKIDNIIGKSVNIRLKSGKFLKILFKRK